MQDVNPCARMIHQINSALEKKVNALLKENNLTSAQFNALMALHHMPEQTCTLKELERALRVSQPDAAGIVIRLERKGMVECYMGTEDRRIKYVHLLDLGEMHCLAAQKNMMIREQWLLSGMTKEEQTQFRALLEKACKNVT